MWIQNLLEKFKLHNDKENYPTVVEAIKTGVVFQGTNLWVLIFAIFVASLGLNVNSTAVIIGAMLISPLMGPIMGIGLGIGINDFTLFRLAFHNYAVATVVALTTSTLFFLVSPLNDAHSEILARTSPNIYDVLIALFGGLAGILATSSKLKGNVITGVAIATALMPPLCTAGYGLATFQFNFFFGAFYLYIINTVFIALATFIMVRVLEFPLKSHETAAKEKKARWIGWLTVLSTLLPSLYFGYDIVQQNRFTKNASDFIANEAHFPNDYLLNKKIDPKSREILLVFGGQEIPAEDINQLKSKLGQYHLEKAQLEIKQGFAYLNSQENSQQSDQFNQLTATLDASEQQLRILKKVADSISTQQKLYEQVYTEIKVQYPQLSSAIISPTIQVSDSVKWQNNFVVMLTLPSELSRVDKIKLQKWLEARLKKDSVNLVLQKR